MKRVILFSIVMAMGLLIAGVGLRAYLRSDHVLQQVVKTVEEAYGGPVAIGSVEIGFSRTEIKNLHLWESDRNSEDPPWLKVAVVHLDVSLSDLIRGIAFPKQVRFEGAIVQVDFDANGNLTTRLPSFKSDSTANGATVLPNFEIVESEVILAKENHAPLTIKNLHLRGQNQGEEGLAFSGAGENAELGKLPIQGVYQGKTSQIEFKMHSDPKARVGPDFLRRLPFVPDEVWKAVQIREGVAQAVLFSRYDFSKKDTHYQIVVYTEQTEFSIPAVNLTAHDAAGKIVIEDSVVRVSAHGKSFGGDVSTRGVLDFRGPTTLLKFDNITVANLDPQKVPNHWNIPAFLRKSIAGGRLFGKAELTIGIRPSHFSPATATGILGILAPHGWMQGLSLALALQTHNLIDTKSEGKGEIRDPSGKRSPVEFDWQLAPKALPVSTSDLSDLVRPLIAQTLIAMAYPNVESESQGKEDAPQAKPQAKAPPTYFDLNFSLKKADMAEFIKNTGLTLPFNVKGLLSFEVKASIPTDQADDLKLYKARGKLQLRQFELANLTLAEVDADFNYDQGVLHLSSLRSKLGTNELSAGSAQGSGSIQVVPLGDLRFDLLLDRVSIPSLLKLPDQAITGTVSGNLALRGNAEKLTDLNNLQGEATVQSKDLRAYGLNLSPLTANLTLKNGVVKIQDLKGVVEGTPFDATAALTLQADSPFTAKLKFGNLNLAAFDKLPPALRETLPTLSGSATTTADLVGKLFPFTVEASGDASAKELQVSKFSIQAVRFHWQASPDQIVLTGLDANLYGGKAVGSATVPLGPSKEGKIDLKLDGVDAKPLARDLSVPFPVEGRVDGTMKGTLPGTKAGQPRLALATMDLQAPKLRVRNIPANQLKGAVEFKEGTINYKLEGKSLGGTFDLEGAVPTGSPAKKAGKTGRLSVRNVQIAEVLQSLGLSENLGFKGRLEFDSTFLHEKGDLFPSGTGKIRITNLRWNQTRLSESILGDVSFSDDEVRVANMTGSFSQGTVVLRLKYNVRQPERGFFSITVDNAESQRFLAAWFDDRISGPVNARIRGNFGATLRGTADVEMARGKVYGLEVADWRLPIQWELAPAQNRGQASVAETTAQVSRGRGVGKVQLSWEQNRARVDGNLRLDRFDLQDFFRQTVGGSQLGGGQASARFDFNGSEVRSINDLNGVLTASFNQTQALQVPVLKQIAPYVGVGPSTTFQKGDLRGRMTRGVLRIENLTLQGVNAQMFVEGTASLEGRLNLEVVARSGELGLPQIRIGALAVRIPPVGPVPLLVLQEATALFANRVVYLNITGTVNDPVLRVRPLPILSEEAVRFFLNRTKLPVTFSP